MIFFAITRKKLQQFLNFRIKMAFSIQIHLSHIVEKVDYKEFRTKSLCFYDFLEKKMYITKF